MKISNTIEKTVIDLDRCIYSTP